MGICEALEVGCSLCSGLGWSRGWSFWLSVFGENELSGEILVRADGADFRISGYLELVDCCWR
jgi:hypothetical protein